MQCFIQQFCLLTLIFSLIISCGPEKKSVPQPIELHENLNLHSELAGTHWHKLQGKCGYGLDFENTAAMFYYYFACRLSPNQRGAMARMGYYEVHDTKVIAEASGITCANLASERKLNITILSEQELSVETVSETILLTRKVQSNSQSKDEVIYGCIDSKGKFTPHGWL